MLFLVFANMLNLSRPKELPPLVPDCGWNHGEMKKETNTENDSKTCFQPTSSDVNGHTDLDADYDAEVKVTETDPVKVGENTFGIEGAVKASTENTTRLKVADLGYHDTPEGKRYSIPFDEPVKLSWEGF
jgi:hypothetical protein